MTAYRSLRRGASNHAAGPFRRVCLTPSSRPPLLRCAEQQARIPDLSAAKAAPITVRGRPLCGARSVRGTALGASGPGRRDLAITWNQVGCGRATSTGAHITNPQRNADCNQLVALFEGLGSICNAAACLDWAACHRCRFGKQRRSYLTLSGKQSARYRESPTSGRRRSFRSQFVPTPGSGVVGVEVV